MGKFNVRLNQTYTYEIEEILHKNNIKVRYVDKVLNNLIILEAKSSNDLLNFSFIRTINETRIGKLLDTPIKKHKQYLEVTPIPILDLEKYREQGLYGFGNNIAVIDSGHDIDISGLVTDDRNFTEDANSYDTCGHGSIVISLLKKITPAAKIYSAKVCVDDEYIDEENVFRALDWVTTLPDVKCINLSLGMDASCKGDCELAEKINAMSEMGYIIVAAMGNSGSVTHCPACAENAISVGALDKTGNRVASFSSKGHINSNKPDLVTSGHGLTKRYFGQPHPYQGTSFAAPIVTGLLGATYHMFKEGKNVKDYLITSCESLVNEPRPKQGYGKLNLQKFLEEVNK